MLHSMPIVSRIADLNAQFKDANAEEVLTYATGAAGKGRLAMVSSFGAESVVLLHMLSKISATTPVIFIDTEMLFPETLAYQQSLSQQLGLTDVRKVGPSRADLITHDNENLLHLYDPDACCALRKSEPLRVALQGFDGWISGRKRYQGAARLGLEFFENSADGKCKINPLVHWGSAELQAYIQEHALPRHPLVARGFPSIGCTPCTTRVAKGEDARAGRWRGRTKTECGIHFDKGAARATQHEEIAQ